MEHDPRLWKFVPDTDYSGSVTISDVWLWFKWLFFYPGDGAIYLFINGLPELAQSLEIDYRSYGGVLSFVISFLVWVVVIVIRALSKSDKGLTSLRKG